MERGEKMQKKKDRTMLKKIKEKLPELTILEIIVLLMALGLYLDWAALITFNTAPTSAPDELMRYMLPDFIFRYNRLPTGYDSEVIHGIGNWSYAFYPQFLGPILSAMFMNLVSLFRTGPFVLVFAARMASVLAGVTTVFFVNRTLRGLTKDERISLLGMVLIACWPQFAFLSSYINNDIIALAGVSIMTYAAATSLKSGWTMKGSITLAIGMAICLLSYLNSYGFVLSFGLYFLISNFLDIRKKQLEWKAFWKKFAVIFAIVAILWFPFLARNAILYNGDLFGMNSFNAAMSEWEQNESMEWAMYNAKAWSYYHNIPWDENTVFQWIETWTAFEYRGGYLTTGNPFEGNVLELLRDRSWREITGKSFVTTIYFALADHFSRFIYWFYGGLILTSLIGVVRIKTLNIKQRYFLGACGLGSLITISLFLIYNLYRDSQPQGRYFIAILVPLAIAMAIGIDTLLKRAPKRVQRVSTYSVIALSIGMMLYIFSEFMRL